MTFKILFLTPVLVSAFWISKTDTAQATSITALESAPALRPVARTVSDERAVTLVVARKIRLQRVLGHLDHVAEIAIQMSPDRSANLEPVIVELAEQAVALSEDDTVTRASTDTELDRLEVTVQRLVNAIDRMVEPEISI